MSAERGTPVKPKLSFGFLTLRTTRLPFLTATIIPVVLGILIAASHGSFDLFAAILTVVGASFVQLGLNVANDVFDTVQGADDANVTPTQFSGGSRVIQYGLVSLRQMATLATVFYVLAGIIGLILLATHGSPALLVIGVLGFIVSLGYTAPPLKFVYRGLGEIAVAIGFGPLMLLGAYVVQTGGALAWEPFVASIPIALLVALILYVNEIPDRRGDARVGKRTLPVRFSETTVITGYNVAAAAAFVILVAGVVIGFLPVPALAMLLTIPMARQVSRGLRPNYDNPYGLMAIMGVNVQLHLRAGAAASRGVRGRADRRGRGARSEPLHPAVIAGPERPRTPRNTTARGLTTLPRCTLVLFDRTDRGTRPPDAHSAATAMTAPTAPDGRAVPASGIDPEENEFLRPYVPRLVVDWLRDGSRRASIARSRRRWSSSTSRASRR